MSLKKFDGAENNTRQIMADCAFNLIERNTFPDLRLLCNPMKRQITFQAHLAGIKPQLAFLALPREPSETAENE